VPEPVNIHTIHARWGSPSPLTHTDGGLSFGQAVEGIDALIGEIEHLREKLADLDSWPECADCGCTDAEACLGGCSWVPPVNDGDPLLCSTCVDLGAK